MSVLLEVKGLSSGYGKVPVLHGIEFQVAEKEVLGVLGNNGMGKSTLLKTLMGILSASAGTVLYSGQDVTRNKPGVRAQYGMGYVPQGRGIFSNLSVLDNLRMGVVGHGLDEEDAVRNIVLDFPRLEGLLDRSGGTLSGGEQQILALARCLISEPDLILLDEPTEGIQPSIVDEIGEILLDLNRRKGLTIILVEQNIEFITELSQRIKVMEKGTFVNDIDLKNGKDHLVLKSFSVFGTSKSQVKTSSEKPSIKLGTVELTSSVDSEDKLDENIYWPNRLSNRIGKMTVQRPTFNQLKDIVSDLGMNLSNEQIQEFLNTMQGTLDAYDLVDSLPDYLPPVLYPRTSGNRPSEEENPLNAWYIKTEVRGAPSGPLTGKTVALKDNVCLAGVPMMNGSSTLKGYTPDIDATVVTRLLDAGATIVGKAHSEHFCLSGGSHTNSTGAVHNPYRHGYSAGGSSSGSGALVGGGMVDMAIGGDQGGSIRIPASFSGCYGLKPSHGLVPYSGIMPIETTIDHAGPMTQTVMDNALMLEVIAGSDGLDPRQYDVKTDSYTRAVNAGVSGLKIGIVKEGFGHESSETDVDLKVMAAAKVFSQFGATVDQISMPWHLKGSAIWTPIALEGLTNQMMHGNGMGTGWEGLHTTSLLDYHANWRHRADELSDTLKISMFVGEYFLKHHRGHYYSKAQNLSRQLKVEINKVLTTYDLLLMPTLPMKATRIPDRSEGLEVWCQRAFEMLVNTAPYDVSGHPAMSVPCGMSDGLPVGMMLIGRRYDESSIYRAAGVFEANFKWKEM